MARKRSLLATLALFTIPWFLWSSVYPGGAYREQDITTQPVKEFRSQDECLRALPAYRTELEKAYPNRVNRDGTAVSGFVTWPTFRLTCSPVYPR